MRETMKNTRLGDFLLERGLVSEEQLEEAVTKQEKTLKPLGGILLDMKVLTEAELVHVLADQLEIRFVDLFTTPLQVNAVDLIPEHIARKYTCIPISMTNGTLDVVMCDPMDLDALEELSKTANAEINPMISTRADILESIELQYFTRNYRASHVQQLENEIQKTIKEDRAPEKEARVFGIISNKGGVGKTHTAVNLSSAFASMNMKTLLIDVDLGNANVSVKIGVHPKLTLMDFLNEEKKISEIITPTPYGFDFIAGQAGEFRLANLAYVQKLRFIQNFHEVSGSYDVVVLDLSAGIDATVVDFALAANEVIILTTPQDIVAGYACLKATYYRFKELETKLEEKLDDYEAKDTYSPKYIINQVESPQMGRRVFDKINATANKHFDKSGRFKIDPGYLGYIPYDREVFRETEKMRKPYITAFRNRSAAKCLRHIAAELLKPSSLRTPMAALAAVPRQGTNPLAPAPAKSSSKKGGFRRFVEILRMKL